MNIFRFPSFHALISLSNSPYDCKPLHHDKNYSLLYNDNIRIYQRKSEAVKCVIYKTNYIRMRLSEIRSNSLQHVSIYSSSEEHLGDSGNLHSSVAQITALLKPYVSEFVCKAMCVCVREDVSPQTSRLCKRCMRR